MFVFCSSTSSTCVAGADALVVVVDGDREDLLGALLADDVLVERVVDLARVGQLRCGRLRARRLEHLLVDDLPAEIDALVADVDALARDQLADLLLALAAERAAIREPSFPCCCWCSSDVHASVRRSLAAA